MTSSARESPRPTRPGERGGVAGHTLLIQDPKLDGFLLTTNADGRKSGKVKLAPGKYILYCNVDGHEGQGMKATLTVS